MRRQQRNHFCVPSKYTTPNTNSEYEDHLSIDRTLYNVYGELSSLVRATAFEWHYIDYKRADTNLINSQNDVIHNFLQSFVENRQDNLIEAFENLSLSQEILAESEKQKSKAVQAEALPSINCNFDRGSDQQSSIISIQSLIVPSNLNENNPNAMQMSWIKSSNDLGFRPLPPPPPSSASRTFDFNESHSSFSYDNSSAMPSPMSLDNSLFILSEQSNNSEMNLDISERHNTRLIFEESHNRKSIFFFPIYFLSIFCNMTFD